MTNRDKLIVDMEVKIKQLQDEHFKDREIFAEEAKKKERSYINLKISKEKQTRLETVQGNPRS